MKIFRHFTSALMVSGLLCILVGASNSLHFGNYSLEIQDKFKFTVMLIGGCLLIIAIFLELMQWERNKKEENNAKISQSEKSELSIEAKALRADNLIFPLDKHPLGSFQSFTKGARKVYILGRTMVNLLSQNSRVIEDLCASGCEIKILFVDPSWEGSGFLYGISDDTYQNNVRSCTGRLRELLKKGEGRFHPKIIRHAPPFSVIIVGFENAAQNFIHVGMYFLHSRHGFDRPTFIVRYGDRWYQDFVDEFDALWDNAREWEVVISST